MWIRAKKGLLGAIVFVVHTFRFRVGAQLGKVDVSRDIMMNRMASLSGLVLMLSTLVGCVVPSLASWSLGNFVDQQNGKHEMASTTSLSSSSNTSSRWQPEHLFVNRTIQSHFQASDQNITHASLRIAFTHQNRFRSAQHRK